jgi:hypothetical protein
MISVAPGVPDVRSGLLDDAGKRAQQVRLKRFGLSMGTFAVALCATFLITCLGLGEISGPQWALFVGVGLLGSGFFAGMYYSGANLRFSESSLTREQIVFWSCWGLFPLYWLPEVRPIVLLFYLPPFSFGMLILTLRQYLVVVGCVLALYAGLLGFEYFQDPQVFDYQYQLFLFGLFALLLIWFAFFGGFVSNVRRRLREEKDNIKAAHEELKLEIDERTRIQLEKDALIVELKDALGQINTLTGFLPICASCKKIRDDKGYWNQIEAYVRDHSNAEFSHGICPDCAEHYYRELDSMGE